MLRSIQIELEDHAVRRVDHVAAILEERTGVTPVRPVAHHDGMVESFEKGLVRGCVERCDIQDEALVLFTHDDTSIAVYARKEVPCEDSSVSW
jgi:hypothetical protein